MIINNFRLILNSLFHFINSNISFFFFLEDHFKDCHPTVSDFDECIQYALNEIRPYFKTGVPKFGAHIPFEPFFIKKARTSRGTPNFGFVITMTDIEEVGWDLSKVIKFTSDLKNYKVKMNTFEYLRVWSNTCRI